MKYVKDQIAIQKGYPSWDDIDWVCREGERNQRYQAKLMEEAMKEYIKLWHLQQGGEMVAADSSFVGWSEDERKVLYSNEKE